MNKVVFSSFIAVMFALMFVSNAQAQQNQCEQAGGYCIPVFPGSECGDGYVLEPLHECSGFGGSCCIPSVVSSCQEIADSKLNKENTLYLDGDVNKPYRAFCSEDRRTFLIFPKGKENNFIRFPYEYDGSEFVIRWDKIEFDPKSRTINIDDFTFAEISGSVQYWTEPKFGKVGNCLPNTPNLGTGKIDLTGTPFKITSEWLLYGWNSSGGAIFSNVGQTVDISGGSGSGCGGCKVDRDLTLYYTDFFTNIAHDKPVDQSSTAYGGFAEKAVDGDTNGDFNLGSVTHTEHEPGAWWKVDLEDYYDISHIKIWNRTDGCYDAIYGCGNRLNDFSIIVDNEVVYRSEAKFPGSKIFHINKIGKKIKIQLGVGFLQLAEVEVFGTKRPFYNGLVGTYDHDQFLNDPVLERVDSEINFDWGTNSPSQLISSDHFYAKWEGFIRPKYSELYEFHTLSDDGVRLWVNGQLIINNWTGHSPTENTGIIYLESDKYYTIKMNYFESSGGAVAKLLWSSASQAKEIIPNSQLFVQYEETDKCPNNPDKTEPGECGCDLADTDRDNDGVVDCIDKCPNNPDRTEPGECGCFLEGTDRDNDNVLDCRDECPDDPNKVYSGKCGCGRTEDSCDVEPLTNIALNKSAWQSLDYADAVASKAVDGNSNGNYINGSVSITEAHPNAWWTVDLGDYYDISHIRIWNRTDCCYERLNDFNILIDGRVIRSHLGTFQNSKAFNINEIGRYVTIQLNGSNYLQLAEVEVFGGYSSMNEYIINNNYDGTYDVQFAGEIHESVTITKDFNIKNNAVALPVFGDFNGDGLEDYAYRLHKRYSDNYYESEIYKNIFVGNGYYLTTSFDKFSIVLGLLYYSEIESGDFNCDGIDDLVYKTYDPYHPSAEPTDVEYTVFYSNKNGTFTEETIIKNEINNSPLVYIHKNGYNIIKFSSNLPEQIEKYAIQLKDLGKSIYELNSELESKYKIGLSDEVYIIRRLYEKAYATKYLQDKFNKKFLNRLKRFARKAKAYELGYIALMYTCKGVGIGLDELANQLENSSMCTGDELDGLGLDPISDSFDEICTSPHHLAYVLRQIGYGADEAARFMEFGYSLYEYLEDESMAAVLKYGGYAVHETAGALKDVYNITEGDVANILRGAGYAASEVEDFMNNVGGYLRKIWPL